MASLQEWNKQVNTELATIGKNFDHIVEALVEQKKLNEWMIAAMSAQDERIKELEKTVAELIILKS